MNIQDLSNEFFYNMGNYHQVTIDLVQEAEDVIDEKDSTDSFGALAYQTQTVLEVCDPKFIHDVKALKNLIEILEKEQETLRAELCHIKVKE